MRRWLAWVTVVAAVGLALPLLIGEGEQDRVPRQATEPTASASWTKSTPGPMSTPPPVPDAPNDGQGCPEWIDTWDVRRELTAPGTVSSTMVTGRPDAAVVCRYLVRESTGTRRADLAGTRPLPDAAAYAFSLGQGEPLPGTGMIACASAHPTYEYLVLFTGGGLDRQVVHVSGQCQTAGNAAAMVRIDVRTITELATLFPAR